MLQHAAACYKMLQYAAACVEICNQSAVDDLFEVVAHAHYCSMLCCGVCDCVISVLYVCCVRLCDMYVVCVCDVCELCVFVLQ